MQPNIRSSQARPERCDGRRSQIRRPYKRLAAMLAAGFLAATSARAQVRPVQGGNALDANPLTGSAGYNAARPTTAGINGNLIMSGNVSAGKSFQGYSPIQNSNTLMTNIPSAGLGNFVRDSVGLPTITSGQNNYVAQPYFNPSSTAVSTGIVQNQVLLPRQVTGTFSVNQNQGQMPVMPIIGIVSPDQLAPQPFYAAPYWQPAGTGLFRPDVTAVTSGNPLEPYSLSSPVEVSGMTTVPPKPSTPQAEAGKAVLPPESPLTLLIKPELSEVPNAGPLTAQPSKAGGTPGANLALLPNAPNTPTESPGAAMGSVTGTLESEVPGAAPQLPGTTGAPETSSTLLTAMQRHAKAIQELINPAAPKQLSPVEAAARTPADKLLLLSPNLTAAQRQTARMNIQEQEAAQLVEARLKAPIQTMAGARRTRIDQMFGRAEELMRQGQYYQASHMYGTIAAVTPDNPLAWMGESNALLAAGDYLGAYKALEQSIQRFPQVLQFNFDLPSLVGNREVLDVRRSEIEHTLAGRPNDYQLRFLLGYLEYFSGLRDIGLQTLKQAGQEAPAGSVVQEAYQILSKQQAPATRPA